MTASVLVIRLFNGRPGTEMCPCFKKKKIIDCKCRFSTQKTLPGINRKCCSHFPSVHKPHFSFFVLAVHYFSAANELGLAFHEQTAK